jgi:hypothetical protein
MDATSVKSLPFALVVEDEPLLQTKVTVPAFTSA